MQTATSDEWAVVETLLPSGWKEAAKAKKAFQRVRYTQTPSEVLRLLLLHAASKTGLRDTVALARAAKISTMSQVALFKRMKTAGAWLEWIGCELAKELRPGARDAYQGPLRLRVIDGTTVQGPAARNIDWRLHFAIDLMTLNCDWFELTSHKKGEALWRVPMAPNDVLLADRYYLTKKGMDAATKAGAFVLIRMRWNHARMVDSAGEKVSALQLCGRLRVGEIGDWPVTLTLSDGTPCSGRIVATKLPAPLAARSERKIRSVSRRKNTRLDKRSIKATHYVMVFTTLPAKTASKEDVLKVYRARWQIELVFKRMKQLLGLGQLPHKNRKTGRTWILAKLILSFLIEKLHRQAQSFSPWGYSFHDLRTAA